MKNKLNEYLIHIVERYRGKIPKGSKRSKEWLKFSKEIKTKNPKCAVCESKEKLIAHHFLPFHIAPDLELDEKNIVILCESNKYGKNCHLLFGHHGNWKRWNPELHSDIQKWKQKLIGFKTGK